MAKKQIIPTSDDNRKKYQNYLNVNGLHSIYMQPEYLDVVFPSWKLLSLENGTFIPLCVNRKMLLPYVVIPNYLQHFTLLTKRDAQEVLAFLKSNYKQFDLSLNIEVEVTKIDRNLRVNYYLPIQSHENLVAQYNTNTKRNIKKSWTQGDAFVALTKSEITRFIKADNSTFLDSKKKQLLFKFIQSEKVDTLNYGIKNKDNILASTVWIKFNARHYYLYGQSSALGKEHKSMFLLFDHYFKHVAIAHDIIDFEGSMLPGVARFYVGFGAQKESYFHYQKKLSDFLTKL